MHLTFDVAQPAIGRGEVVLAFDVGGTDTKSALIDGEGRIVGLRRTPTPHENCRPAEAVVQHIAELARDLTTAFPRQFPVAAGLLVPGIVDARRGVGVYSSNLGWRNQPIQHLAESAMQLPVAFHHDVTAASWAEHRLGAARAFQDVVVLIIGTGIAGSLILGGRPHLAGGYAGEIGHSPVAEQPQCVCGARGCLETIASTRAIAARYTELSGVLVPGAREVLQRAASGDRAARTVWESAMDALALAIAQLTAVVAPQAIVIGGGLSRAGDELFAPLTERVHARLSFHHRPVLLPAELGEDAGLLGAALIARDGFAA